MNVLACVVRVHSAGGARSPFSVACTLYSRGRPTTDAHAGAQRRCPHPRAPSNSRATTTFSVLARAARPRLQMSRIDDSRHARRKSAPRPV